MKILYKSWFILFLLLFSCNSKQEKSDAGSNDWSIFRGNPSLNAYTKLSLPANPVLLWTFASNSYTKSSPVVYNQVTYWSDRRGRIFGINIEGKQVFDYAPETAVEATPTIDDSVIYIGRMDGIMTAVSLNKKDSIWNYETKGQTSASPNMIKFEGHRALVFGSYDNYLYCVDAKTGEELSRFESGYYLNAAAAVWKDYVIFGGCDAWIRIIDTRTGIQTDSLSLDAYIPASPAVMDDDCYVGDYSGNIYHLALLKGKIASSKKIIESKDGSLVSSPAVSDKMVYIISGDKYLYAINRKDDSGAWKYLLKGNTGESSPVVCNDKVIACTKTGIVSILDAGSSKLLWEYDTGEQITASPAVIAGHFMILSTKGTLLCFGKK